MVVEIDPEERSGRREPVRDGDVVAAGLHVTRRMIVERDNRRRAAIVASRNTSRGFA
jgi:hypothetical protein